MSATVSCAQKNAVFKMEAHDYKIAFRKKRVFRIADLKMDDHGW